MRWLVLIALFFAGCARTVYVPVVRNSSIVDTVVMTSEDSSLIRALLVCDSSGRVLLGELEEMKGKMAIQNVTLDSNELTIKTRWLTRIVERRVEVRDTTTVVEVKEVELRKPYIPKFFWGCFAFAFCVIAWKVVRFVKLF